MMDLCRALIPGHPSHLNDCSGVLQTCVESRMCGAIKESSKTIVW